MEPITIYPKSEEQANLFEQLAKALDVRFEKKEGSYNEEFVAKIKRSEENYNKGKFTTIKVEDLWK
jgi:hypothetical protein